MTNSKTKQFLELLVKRNLTSTEIKKELELDDAQFRSLICYMQKRGYIESAPVTYALSYEGFQRLKHKPKGTPEELARGRARRKREKMAESFRAKGFITNVFQLGGAQP